MLHVILSSGFLVLVTRTIVRLSGAMSALR
jgi:hypothetical protein